MEKDNNNGRQQGFGKIGINRTESRSDVSLWLDNYGDLFSDFDSRHYSTRALSDDFLEELKRATRDIEGGTFHLKLLVPTALRKPDDESMIKKRLKEHFKRHTLQLQEEFKKKRKRGIFLAAVGMLLLTVATFLYQQDSRKWWISSLIILFEPAGWFTVWIGLEQTFFIYEEHNHKLNRLFYEKMDKAEIRFDRY